MNVLGQEIFGSAEFGGTGGGTTGGAPQSQAGALSLSYSTVTSSAALALSADIQLFAGIPLLLSYWVIPALTQFAVNGNTDIPAPQHMSYQLPAQYGYDQSGVPLVQGYTTIVWNYERLQDADAGKLMALYNPDSPMVTVNYPNELGIWVSKQAMMQPPVMGQRQTVEHTEISITFSHIIPD